MVPENKSPVRDKLAEHFGNLPPEDIATATRTYAQASRVDLQLAIDIFFEKRPKPIMFGVLGSPFTMGENGPTLALLFGRMQVDIGPLQHDEVDTGDIEPA